MRHTTHMRGFSLIELLVSLTLFTIVAMISVGTLLSLVDANRKAQAVVSVTNNLQFAVDSMARTIATGAYYYCGIGTPGEGGWTPKEDTRNCDSDDANQWLGFIDDDGDEVVYYYEDGAIWRIKDGGSPKQMTADEVEVTAATFFVTGTVRDANTVQPTVTIMVQATGGPELRGVTTEYNLQVTVAQRILDL